MTLTKLTKMALLAPFLVASAGCGERQRGRGPLHLPAQGRVLPGRRPQGTAMVKASAGHAARALRRPRPGPPTRPDRRPHDLPRHPQHAHPRPRHGEPGSLSRAALAVKAQHITIARPVTARATAPMLGCDWIGPSGSSRPPRRSGKSTWLLDSRLRGGLRFRPGGYAGGSRQPSRYNRFHGGPSGVTTHVLGPAVQPRDGHFGRQHGSLGRL